MNDEDNSQKDTKLGVSAPTLKLNRSFDSSRIQQSFTHGRSKTVTVEVKRKRFAVPGKPGSENEIQSGDANSRLHAINSAAEAARHAEEQRKVLEQQKQEELSLLKIVEEAKNEEVAETEVLPLVEKVKAPVVSFEADLGTNKVDTSDFKKRPFAKSGFNEGSVDSYAETEALKKSQKIEQPKTAKTKYDDSKN